MGYTHWKFLILHFPKVHSPISFKFCWGWNLYNYGSAMPCSELKPDWTLTLEGKQRESRREIQARILVCS